MKNGKISESVLKRSVLKQLHTKSDRILFKPAVGEDCAVISMQAGDQTRLVTATQTFTLDAVSYTHLIIFSFFGYLMGLGIVGMLASKMSKKAKQYNNAIATAGLITSIIGFVLSVICTIGMVVLFASGIYDRLVNMSML